MRTEFGLEKFLQRKPKELSGGQRQRVALGRAIVRDAQVFLLPDEKDVSRITSPVEVVEHLGNELLVYMTVAVRNIVARLDPRSSTHAGGTVTLHVDTDHIHLFDTDNGAAIF